MKRVAVIVEDSGDKRWDALLNGLKQSAENNNLHLIICNTDLIESMEDEEELINEQLQNNVDAFVICPAPGKETKTMLNRLQGERPFILINEDTYAEEPSGYATVKPDNYKIGQMLAERLIQDDEEQLENKKIGVILGKAETEENVNRIAGLKDGLEGSGCEISWELIGNDCRIYEHVMPERLYTNLKMKNRPMSMMIDKVHFPKSGIKA